MSRVNNDADLLLRVRRDKISRVNNDADLLQRVRQDKKSGEWGRSVATNKTRSEE